MSTKYPGGIITKTYVAPTPSSASGIWTLDQQEQAQKAGIWPFGGPFNYIEDVFSTYLYTGTGAALTVTNGIDLSTKGGLVWIKNRGTATTPPANANDHILFDTSRGQNVISSNTAAAQYDQSAAFTPLTTGFSLSTSASSAPNTTGASLVSWTFRKQPKFFDVVTYTGNGANRTIAHSLGSVPGSIIIKRTDTTANWAVYHRSLANTQYLVLNSTAAAATGATWWNSTTPTSAVFSLGTDASVNASGGTYVAYIYAHDAGGFGLSGTDNVISCGSYNRTDGVKSVVNLGYEPQFIIQRTANAGSQWTILDVMRGWTGASNSHLFANLSNQETTGNIGIMPTATGFEDYTTAGATETMIYIAIRRGPMKVPTDATKVYTNVLQTTAIPSTLTTGFPVDLLIQTNSTGNAKSFSDRLRGSTTSTYRYLQSTNTNAEASGSGGGIGFDNNTGVINNLFEPYPIGYSTGTNWSFKRAPSFFDEVCYTGTGSARTVSHNLGAVPELMIVKKRSATGEWFVYTSATTATKYLQLNTSDAAATSSAIWNNTAPTSSEFSLGTNATVNGSGATCVAYLFSTCAGVSKVGSYTGTGATQTVNCGFTGGARFVLIKRSDAAFSNWYVWDTARGMVSGTDPRLFLNTTGAEVNADEVFTASTGFQVVSTADALNASGGSYIFLAIA